jgi:hypothetical protein
MPRNTIALKYQPSLPRPTLYTTTKRKKKYRYLLNTNTSAHSLRENPPNHALHCDFNQTETHIHLTESSQGYHEKETTPTPQPAPQHVAHNNSKTAPNLPPSPPPHPNTRQPI